MRASSVLSLSREKLVKRHVVMRLMARGAGAFWPMPIAWPISPPCLKAPHGARCFLTERGWNLGRRNHNVLMRLLVLGAF